MADKITVAVSAGVFVLLLAFALPAAINATQEPSTIELEMADNSPKVSITGALIASVDTTNADSAEIQLEDDDHSESHLNTVNEGETVAYDMPGGTVNVTAINTTTQEVVFTVTYPRDYGWDSGASSLLDNLPILFVVLSVLLVVGLIVGVKP